MNIKLSSKKAVLLGIVSSAVVFFPSLVLAQNVFTEEVEDQLLAAMEILGLDGYELSHEPFVDELMADTEDDLTISLSQGVDYQIIAVCDGDCDDIDLSLYDDNGNLIDTDTEVDDVPLVGVTPEWDAEFTVKITIPSCAASSCYYGVGILAR